MTSLSTWFLQKTDLLQQLSPEDFAFMEANARDMTKARGELVYLDTDDEPQVYLIKDGYLRLVRMNMEGKRFTLNILRPGELFGALNLEKKPEHLDEFLEMLSPVSLIAVDSETFVTVMNRNPEMCFSVVQILDNRNRQIENRLSQLLFKDVHARIAQLFLDMTFQHGRGCPYAFGLNRDICLTHQEVAELVGASRPVVSAVISQFLKIHLVHKHNGYICLQDLEKLRLVAQEGASAVMSVIPAFEALL